jgi:tetratricopeptide (TPR) repeat protein
MQQPLESVAAYQRALTLCPLYSDCYFNLGNLYFEGDPAGGLEPDIDRAEESHLNALSSLEEKTRA